MTELPRTMEIVHGVLEQVGDAYVAGHSYVDENGRWVLQLGLGDGAGDREVSVVKGDTFEFVGATWKVATVYEPAAGDEVASVVRVVAHGTRMVPRAMGTTWPATVVRVATPSAASTVQQSKDGRPISAPWSTP